MKIILKWVTGLAVVTSLYFFLDLSGVGQAIAKSNPLFLLAGLLPLLMIRLLGAWQTVLVVRCHQVNLSLFQAFYINLTAGFYSLFTPGGVVSALVRWQRISKPSGKRAEVFAAIIFLRLINALVLLFLGIAAILLDSSLRQATGISYVSILILFCSLLLLTAAMFNRNVLIWWEKTFRKRLGRFFQKIHDKIRKVWIALQVYKKLSRKELLKILIIPLLDQLFGILLLLCIAMALEIELPFVALVWLRSLIFIFHFVPGSISGLGIRESAFVLILPHYGVNPASALAFSLSLFGFQMLMGLFGGIFESKKWFLVQN